MKKRLLIITFLCLLLIPNNKVLAAKTTNCISNFTFSGSTRRYRGHQTQWFKNGTYTVKGTVNESSCFSFSGGGSIVKFQVAADKDEIQFSPQNGGVANVSATLKSSCSCSGTDEIKNAVFTFSEWGLSSLKVTGYSLSPKFDNMISEYTITVPTNINTVDLEINPNESNAKIKVNGKSISGNNTTAEIINNKISIEVTTSVGDARTTVINVKRSAYASIAPNSSSKASSSSKAYIPVNSARNDDNPDAGSAEMFIIWFLGIAAIGYSVYYFKTVKNTNI